jgi:phosphoglycolate phosphatase
MNEPDTRTFDTGPFDTVIFDLDGTVSDSASGILASLDHAFADTGLTPPDDLVRFIGPPLQTAFEAEGFTLDEISTLIASYRAHYWEIGAFGNIIYPGIETVLDTLAAEGFRLAIATSKPELTARRILEYFGYTDRFEVIGGATFDMSRATKPAVLEYVLAQLAPTRAVMVGDRYHDVEGAAEHGLPCVGVSWGYAAEGELKRAGARWIVDEPHEILTIARNGL